MNTIEAKLDEIKKRCEAAKQFRTYNADALNAEIVREVSALAQALDVAVKALEDVTYPNYCGGEQKHCLDTLVERQSVTRQALDEINDLLTR